MDKPTILYEDEHILAIDKPAGIIVHGDGKRTDPTLVDWFLEQYPDSVGVGEEPIETATGTTIDRSGIVHRLDRETSGVLLLAKTDVGHVHLKQQFQERTVTKTYGALVYGNMKEDTYHVTASIGRAKNFGRWTAIAKSQRGTARDAETSFTVLDRFEVEGEKYSVLEARPKTGRTHQIRVHLQYLNYPIVADPLYAGKRNVPEHNLTFTRQALHAKTITFTAVDGTEQTATSDLPDQFTIQ